MTSTAATIEDQHALVLGILARASSPGERIAGGWLRAGDPATAHERLAGWMQKVADGRGDAIADILDELGHTLDEWCAGLADATVVAGEPLPEWAEHAVTLFGLLGTRPEADPAQVPLLREIAGDGLPEWVDPEQPWRFHRGFHDWLAAAEEAVDGWCAGTPITPAARRDLLLDLARRMLVVTGPLLMQVAGTRPAAQELFAGDLRADWLEIWSGYPVAARLLATAWRQWRLCTLELCGRVAADLPELRPGLQVRRLGLSAGDQHDDGRTVARLELSDGSSIYLKPRWDGLHQVLGALLDLVDAAGEPLGVNGSQALPDIVERDGYVWAGEVPAADCDSAEQVAGYFRRAGVLVRVAQAVGATDLHHENFIPTAQLPVLVDLETVVAPGILATLPAEDRLTARISDSPGPTSMVTSVIDGRPGRSSLDIGALAGPTEMLTPYAVPQLTNSEAGPGLGMQRVPMGNGSALPHLAGQPVGLRGFEQSLIDGYAAADDRLTALARGPAMAAVVAPGGPEPVVRMVVRATRVYAGLLQQSTGPAVLTDGVDREMVLHRLFRAIGSAPRGLIGAEVTALRENDIPLFLVPFARSDLISERGTVLSGALSESPAARTLRRLQAIPERADHVDDLRASVFAMDPAEPTGSPAPPSGAAVEPGVLAEPIALLVDRAIRTADGSVGWLGLEHDPNRNRWQYDKVGPGLAGQAGIGLALAAAAALSPVAPAGTDQVARAALLGAFGRIARRAGRGDADAFGGPSGVLYAAAVAGRLLRAEDLTSAAHQLIDPCLRAARRREPSISMDAAAGGILALLQLPDQGAVADALTELETLLGHDAGPVDAADVWSASLPGRAAGTALARHRFRTARGLTPPEPGPPPATPGDAVAAAVVGDPGPSTASVSGSPRVLLDELALAQAAARHHPAHAARHEQLVAALLRRRAAGGRWAAPLLAPDRTLVSAVHGMAAITLLCLPPGPDTPIVRALS